MFAMFVPSVTRLNHHCSLVKPREPPVAFGRSPFDNFGPALYDALRPGQAVKILEFPWDFNG